jgi:hypothetical protein
MCIKWNMINLQRTIVKLHKLGFHRVCAHWVLKSTKTQWMDWHAPDDQATGYKTWVHYHIPETNHKITETKNENTTASSEIILDWDICLRLQDSLLMDFKESDCDQSYIFCLQPSSQKEKNTQFLFRPLCTSDNTKVLHLILFNK